MRFCKLMVAFIAFAPCVALAQNAATPDSGLGVVSGAIVTGSPLTATSGLNVDGGLVVGVPGLTSALNISSITMYAGASGGDAGALQFSFQPGNGATNNFAGQLSLFEPGAVANQTIVSLTGTMKATAGFSTSVGSNAAVILNEVDGGTVPAVPLQKIEYCNPTGASSLTVNFTTAFPTKCLGCICQPESSLSTNVEETCSCTTSAYTVEYFGTGSVPSTVVCWGD